LFRWTLELLAQKILRRRKRNSLYSARSEKKMLSTLQMSAHANGLWEKMERALEAVNG